MKSHLVLFPAARTAGVTLVTPSAKAERRFWEFFTTPISNDNTRRAYFNAVKRFADWCELLEIRELGQVQPMHVALYYEGSMRWILLALATMLAFGASMRLFLKDGTYHVVSEYKVLSDRVRFFSLERSDWEEIPLELVDLGKTKGAVESRDSELAAEKKAEAEEEAAEKALRKEIRSVPAESGVYYLTEGSPMKAMKQAELKVVTDKKRQILKVLTPIPILAGKSHVEMDGLRSAFPVAEDRPEFYFRLTTDERFALVRCVASPKGTGRIVERWEVVPVVNEIVVQHEEVQIFRKQVGEGLYKVWPMEPLPTGEYAWIEFTEGKGNTQAWDFSFQTKK